MRRVLPKEAELPSSGLYTFFMSVMRPYYMKKGNVQVELQTEELQKPCVILSNHPSFMDWIYGAAALDKNYLNIVINRYYYYNIFLARLLGKLGAIPKNLFSPDIDTIKRIKQIIKKNGMVYLFPEGRLSPHGSMEAITPATAKLLKNLGVAVYCVHLDGAYLTKPKWADNIRKGRIDLRFSKLFTPEQLSALSESEVLEQVHDALHYDDFRWQEHNRVAYKKKKDFADGLQKILYMCPRCRAEFSMETDDDRIYCAQCGCGAVLNEYYDLVPLDDKGDIPKNIGEWYEWQKNTERQRIESDRGYTLSSHVRLLRPGRKGKWFGDSGEGEARLSREGFFYDGISDGTELHLNIPCHTLPALPFSPGKSFELFSHAEFYKFIPENRMESVKWSVVAEQLWTAVNEEQEKEAADA
ncbi:MAG: 1-acyl-sn-glycerol-3-phosphate acyltransferase [Ruminococcaceae bacterium]|nr:1-acyl-sn-glycerol-3-phosphate acyltransferase [Oscillospiraceae bacterium]